jgi:hypothetical protein
MVDPQLFKRLDEMGLPAVKESLASGLCGQVGSEHHNAVSSWVKLQDEAFAVEAAARAEAREERMLAIASDNAASAKAALAIAQSSVEAARAQARWAMWAAIIATVAAIIAMFKA